jgi:hypothetical protein
MKREKLISEIRDRIRSETWNRVDDQLWSEVHAHVESQTAKKLELLAQSQIWSRLWNRQQRLVRLQVQESYEM